MESPEVPVPVSSVAAEPTVLFKKRAGKSKFRKRPSPPPLAANSESEYSSQDDGEGREFKRRRKNGGVTVFSGAPKTNAEGLEATKFAADRSTTIELMNDATKQLDWFDENAKDELSSKNLLGTTRARPNPADEGDRNSTYRGFANYQSFIQKNPNAPSRQVGPVKAPTNIRTITVTDFAPDVCKDYKQTGFCGFGDSCKFLHAREDYKQGWELDKDWEIGTNGKKVSGKTVASVNRSAKTGDEGDDDAVLLENIPFACMICKEPYKNPIITKCGHYFCEACALQKYRKSPSCAACGAGTGGVFNGAKNLQKLLDKKRERTRQRREKAKEEGIELGDEDEEDEGDEG
ncbi:MAG: hypothetical protein M1827_004502 [Pycnora praestabilis]|nr:MAG: hypothetical protein M1827_004502 [Pycnora praestabilis]